MKTKNKSIGSFQAKTHLSSLINDVEKGSSFIITKRGRPVAKLVPYADTEENEKIDEVILQFDKIRNSVKGKVNIIEFISEGRKY